MLVTSFFFFSCFFKLNAVRIYMLQVTTKALFCPLNFRFYYYNNNICFFKYFLFRNILKKYFFIFKNLFFYISILKKISKIKKIIFLKNYFYYCVLKTLIFILKQPTLSILFCLLSKIDNEH